MLIFVLLVVVAVIALVANAKKKRRAYVQRLTEAAAAARRPTASETAGSITKPSKVLYSVVFKGIAIDADAGTVLASLSQLFKVPADQIAARLRQTRPVFKGGLSESDAVQYQAVLAQNGCIAIVEAELPQILSAVPPQATSTKQSALDSALADAQATTSEPKRKSRALKWLAAIILVPLAIVFVSGAAVSLFVSPPSPKPTEQPAAEKVISSSDRIGSAHALLASWNQPAAMRPPDGTLDATIEGLLSIHSPDPASTEATQLAANLNLKWASSLLADWDATVKKNGSSPVSLYDVRHHLTAIPPESADYRAAQQLMVREERDEASEAKATEAQQHTDMVAEQQALDENSAPRIGFAKALEGRLLEEGKNVDLIATGPKFTTLKYKWIGVSKSFVYQIQNDTTFLENCQTLGFKKVVFTNGYDETYTWDLSKN